MYTFRELKFFLTFPYTLFHFLLENSIIIFPPIFLQNEKEAQLMLHKWALTREIVSKFFGFFFIQGFQTLKKTWRIHVLL